MRPPYAQYKLTLSLATLALAAIEYCRCFTFPYDGVAFSSSHRRTTLSASVADADSATGRLVEFSTGAGAGKTFNLGAVLGPDGKRNFRVLTSSGRTSSVPPRDIRHVVPNCRSASSEAQIEEHERAATTALERDAAAGGQSVAEVWEMLLEDGDGGTAEAVELTTLADLIVGDDSSVSCYAARAVLADGAENFCFKEVNVKNRVKFSDTCTLYEARPVDVVETLKNKARIEEGEAAKWADLKQRIDEACDSTCSDSAFDVEGETKEVRNAFQSLQRLGCLANLSPEEAEREENAIFGEESVAIASAKEFLKKIGRRSTPDSARAIIIGTGMWSIHTNLDVIRLRIPTEFAPELVELATDLASNPPPDADETSRVDLTHLPAFAIDEASTKEIDDALSVEIITDGEEEDGPARARQRLWVHIADPSRYVELGSPLDGEARRRASSLYLPTGTLPMFPMSLASGPLSLRPGEAACALSVGLILDAEGGIDESMPPIITPSLVRTTRLTYDQVDILLDPFVLADDSGGQNGREGSTIDDVETAVDCLSRLDYASERRLQWRKDGGSLESIGPYELPDMHVKAWNSPDELDGWGVDIVAKRRHTANRIVTELMLAANEAIAMYGRENNIPMPFRRQEMTEISDLEVESTPEGPCLSWLAIRSASRSQISSTPGSHDGLGLDVYVQATSPVRRYADLALHHQLKAHLRGDALPFPANDGEAEDGSTGNSVATMVRLAQDGGNVSRLLERPANDYWLKEYLRRRGAEPTEVLVLGGDRWKGDVYKLLLTQVGAIMTYKSSRPLTIGSQVGMPSSTLAECV